MKIYICKGQYRHSYTYMSRRWPSAPSLSVVECRLLLSLSSAMYTWERACCYSMSVTAICLRGNRNPYAWLVFTLTDLIASKRCFCRCVGIRARGVGAALAHIPSTSFLRCRSAIMMIQTMLQTDITHHGAPLQGHGPGNPSLAASLALHVRFRLDNRRPEHAAEQAAGIALLTCMPARTDAPTLNLCMTGLQGTIWEHTCAAHIL